MDEIDRTWKVGDLARATGLTIRALHHYDEIGLLVPDRTPSGHRVYGPAEVERLYRVLALRDAGIALDEIAAVLDDVEVSLVDTVRRHVAAVEHEIAQRHRLLDRLREMLDALERTAEPSVEKLIGAVEAMTVVEATIEDIVTREPWAAAWETSPPWVVLLRETGGDRILPIWIGEPEAMALAIQRSGASLARPMGHDLMASLLGAVRARVERVVIECLRDNTFFATVIVASGGEVREVDARPSDALNLALRCGAPIHVTADLVDTSATTATWPTGVETNAPPWAPVGEGTGAPRPSTYAVGEHSPAMLRRAAEQAHDLGHAVVGSPHLLLGLLADADGLAARRLDGHGVTLDAVREAVAAMTPYARDERSPAPAMCLNPRAMLAMQYAGIEARRRGTMEIADGHLLLALVQSPDAADVLGLEGVDLDAVREDVRAALEA
jgi:bifunctional DNase/RNase